MSIIYSLEIPLWMNEGSHGPHVVLLQTFLFGARFSNSLVLDGEYGSITACRVADLQRFLGMDRDAITGNFSQATRTAVNEKYGFDFEGACLKIPGITRFVQSDGTVIIWEPNIP